MDIAQELLRQLQGQPLENIAQQHNTSSDNAAQAIGNLLPMMVRALERKKTGTDINEYLYALDRDKEGGILDSLEEYMGSPGTANGDEILSSLFGAKRQQISRYVSDDTGLDLSQVSNLLEMAAPVIMSFLARKRNQAGGDIEPALSDFSRNLEQKEPKALSIVDALLDQDGDGEIADDIAEFGKSFLNQYLS